jgi:hypothetical protein
MKFDQLISKYLKENMHGDNWKSTSWTDTINGKKITVTLQDLLGFIENDPIVEISTKTLEPFALHRDKKDPETLKNVEKSDLQYPIIVLKKPNGYQILDGHHRLQKAINNKIPKIKARLIDLKKLPKEYGMIFS